MIDVILADVPTVTPLITYLNAGDYDHGTAFAIERAGLVSHRDNEKGSASELGTDQSAVHSTEK